MVSDRLVALTVLLAVAGGPPVSVAYQEGPVPDAGTIVGEVRVVGEVEPLPPQPVWKQKDYCGTTVPDERLVLGPGNTVAEAVVHIDDIASGKPVPPGPVHLDNRKCAFVPHVVAATVGETLEMRNEDPFLHDAHARIGPRTIFNAAIPKGRTVKRPLTEAGVVHVNCNVRHTWMHAYLFVSDNPYLAATDAKGHYTITEVPPGTHTVAVWHELLGNQERSVTVGPGETVTVDFDLPSTATEEEE